MTIAALYVYEDGVYAGLDEVDVWGIKRDARLYPGPHPVVAHPPCQLWGNLAFVNYKRYGGEHNRPGNDGGMFAHALESVRRYGGVLEHPAFTRAWKAHGLLRPLPNQWTRMHGSGLDWPYEDWVCEVWQSAYGHLARKRTWLLYSGGEPPPPMRWDRLPGTHQIADNKKNRSKPVLRGKHASATPVAFRDALLALARQSRP